MSAIPNGESGQETRWCEDRATLLREVRKLTPAALARRAGMPRKNLWQIEDGRREPTVSTLPEFLARSAPVELT